MKKILVSILIMWLSSSCLAALDDAKIKSVWDMKSQPCNGVFVNNMSRNPNESAIKASKLVVIEDLGFSFKVPQLPLVKESIVKLYLKDKSRGVVDNYILISDQDLEPPFASIVITELPSSITTREQAFSAVNTLENQLAKASGTQIKFDKINGPHGESLEMIVKDRVGSFCFPTSNFKFIPKGYDASTVGVSRFSFIKGKLVEFSLIVTIPSNVSKKDSVTFARKTMDDYWSRLIVI